MAKTYEIRDPIYGFIELNEWERAIVDHPTFQRLRRILQLAWTNMVYPGAMHTRFEHSLGVMHLATRMFDSIVKKDRSILESKLDFDHAGIKRDRMLVRLSALLHDVGHPPFSHAGEGLMPIDPGTGRRYKHEDYSAAAVRFTMKDVIESHPFNQNYHITADEIADFLSNSPRLGRRLLWRTLLSSQLDADRADYLIRDSYHIGVRYGHFDIDRLLVTLTVAQHPEDESLILAIEEGGQHVAEAVILARYQMFTQVYFQHTRRAYDYHFSETMKTLLVETSDGQQKTLPPPTDTESIGKYLGWDDWKVLGLLQAGYGSPHGNYLTRRNHYRCVYHTSEVPSTEELVRFEEILDTLNGISSFHDSAESSWYRFGPDDIFIVQNPGTLREQVTPLSRISSVVAGLRPLRQRRIYVDPDRKNEAIKRIDREIGGGR